MTIDQQDYPELHTIDYPIPFQILVIQVFAELSDDWNLEGEAADSFQRSLTRAARHIRLIDSDLNVASTDIGLFRCLLGILGARILMAGTNSSMLS